jgi:predicted aldo/keto reductase-like oxidoreductase
MLYRKVPKTGDELSILGFGLMRLPTLKNGAIDEERAINQVRSAVDKGVNYLDTAWPYHAGASEPLLAKVLKDGYREKVKIATKLPTWLIQTREDMDKYLNAQLEKLEVQQIDYYLLHTLHGGSWKKLVELGVMAFLDQAIEDGRIKYAGFSFHGHIKHFKQIVDAYPWTFCQIQYNFLDEDYQAGTEGLEYAAKKNLGIIVMEPLRGGNLGNPKVPKAIGDIWNEAERKRTPVEWALRWVWNRPEVTLLLSGMNEEAHIEENMRIADEALPNSLSVDELDQVSRAAVKYKEMLKIDCTACNYCLPCPEGVMIPGAFGVYNQLHLFGNKEESARAYLMRLSGILSETDPMFASLCVECMECVDKCPQNLDIPSLLAQVADELEDDKMDEKVEKIRKIFLSSI